MYWEAVRKDEGAVHIFWWDKGLKPDVRVSVYHHPYVHIYVILRCGFFT